MNLSSFLTETRFHHPERIAQALKDRAPGALPPAGERLIVIAADHPARGIVAAGGDPRAMAVREDLLRRCMTALDRPGVHGFLGAPDMVEDLTVLGALDGKLVYGTANRAGLAGSRFEIDDRGTAYDAVGIVESRLDGAKMLLRLDLDDPATPAALERAARMVGQVARAGRTVLIEPFLSAKREGRQVNLLDPDAAITAIGIAAALGPTSARTWLKVPCVAEMGRVMASTTLPCLLLGGEVPVDQEARRKEWAAALRLPNVMGMVVGRSLLYPRDGDVADAVDRLVEA
ncbi:MAG TPA: deoxyribose-phosphate aldolase [Arachnia sp.]|nr:deoxyribose-phosphate aldolase [Arachnia sp.]HMT86598.1 deoxyribose-phosphate aldolase [Arachnia sp.]